MTSVDQWTCTPCGKQNAWFTLSDFRWLVNILSLWRTDRECFTLSDFRWLVNILSLWRTDRECFTLSDFRWLVNMHSLWRTVMENTSHSVTSGDQWTCTPCGEQRQRTLHTQWLQVTNEHALPVVKINGERFTLSDFSCRCLLWNEIMVLWPRSTSNVLFILKLF